ncbi:MAG: PadR family transcriptional regulator [Clostridiales bacterium]|jgi:PadR family transcriptional regulator PadR|nr:PadR family transcriptional regulator [Clostridiales bacterium]
MERYNTLQYDFKFYVNTIIMRALFEGDKYGYEICKVVEARTNGWYKIKQATLYSCLNRLEAQGMIRSYSNDESATHGGKRRYYGLTQAGIEDFTKSQDEWEYSRTIIDRLISDKEVDLSRIPPPPPPKRKVARKKPAPDVVTVTKTVVVHAESRTGEAEAAEAATETRRDIVTETRQGIITGTQPVGSLDTQQAVETETQAAPSSLTLTLPAGDLDDLRSRGAGDSYSDSVRAQEYKETPAFAAAPAYAFDAFTDDGDDGEDEDGGETGVAPAFAPPPDKKPDAYILSDDERIEPPDDERARTLYRPAPVAAAAPAAPAVPVAAAAEAASERRDYAAETISIEYRDILNRFIKTSDGGKRARPDEAYTAEPDPAPEPDEDVKIRVHRRPERAYAPEDMDGVRVRPHDKEETADYNSKFYIYINRLRVRKNWIVCAALEILVFLCYLALVPISNVATAAEKAYFIVGAVVPIAFPVVGHLCYAIDPDRKKRVKTTQWEDLLWGATLTMGCMVVAAVALSGLWGMNNNNLENFPVRLSVFLVLSFGFAVNAIVFCLYHKNKKFAA